MSASAPSLPTGFDVAHHVHAGRPDCNVTVGFDHGQPYISRFIVQLHYQTSTNRVQWTWIARMDHNETSVHGHDVYDEGLHVDVARRSNETAQLTFPHPPLPPNRGTLIRECVDYFRREAGFFIDVYEERHPPGSPPRWSPDGGDPTRTFISVDPVTEDMSREAPAEEEILTLDELTEALAEAEDTTPEELERQAEEFEIGPPSEATIVERDGPITESDDE